MKHQLDECQDDRQAEKQGVDQGKAVDDAGDAVTQGGFRNSAGHGVRVDPDGINQDRDKQGAGHTQCL